MKHYIHYSFKKILHLTRNSGDPSSSAGVAIGLIWALDLLYILELLFFDGEYPNPVSIILAGIIFFVIYLYCRKHARKMKNKMFPSFFLFIFIVQIIFTLVGFVWFNIQWMS